jgi:hypothetical protein
MPVKRRRNKARDRALGVDERWSLVLGEASWRLAFHTEAERREAWERHREHLLEREHAGRRPAAWWDYDSPIPRPSCRDDDARALYEAGLLSADEVAALMPEWRRHYERSHDPRFGYTLGPGEILYGAPARRALYKWAGMPRELIRKWDAERARRTKTIRKLAQVEA